VEGLGVSRFWQDRRVLITGGSGLVGGWLTQRLLSEGAYAVCLVRDWVPQSILLTPATLDSIVIVRGDVTDQVELERVLGEYEIDTVFHLAAQTIVPIANRNPISTFESNVKGTWALLEACRRSPSVAQVVVASSDKAYGRDARLPYTEDVPLKGSHPYDVSKSCADLIAQSYAETYGLPVTITRCGNFYGGGDLNWNRIVPGSIRSVLRGDRPVIRSDGKFVRDYFHVEDGVEAYVAIAERLAEDRSLAGKAFNFSNEEPIDVLSLVTRLLRIMGSSLEPVVLGEGSNEIRHQYLNAGRARTELGWSPKFTLDEGLSLTVRWYADFLKEQSHERSAVV
jgi:CDP-glucose 4,6-dehydratase